MPTRIKWQHLLELLEMPHRLLKVLGFSWRRSQAGGSGAGEPVPEPGGLRWSRAEAAAVLKSPPGPVGEVLGDALKKATFYPRPNCLFLFIRSNCIHLPNNMHVNAPTCTCTQLHTCIACILPAPQGAQDGVGFTSSQLLLAGFQLPP